MPIPPFVVELRRSIGHDLLWMPGITAVVLRNGGPEVDRRTEVLLVRRSDNGAWTPVTGIADPGEDPDVTAEREVLEETRVVAEVERLIWVRASGVVTHTNGDVAQYLDHTFRCRWVSGEPEPGDDESIDAGWFPVDALPEMRKIFLDRISLALADEPGVRFGDVRVR